MIEIRETMLIPAHVERVWTELADIPTVVSCIPGAELGTANQDGSFDGAMRVAFGPMQVRFEGNVRVVLNADDFTGVISATAKDGRGAARLKGDATIGLRAGAREEETLLSLDGHLQISGRMAAQIESGASLVTSRLSNEFLQCITGRVAGTPPVPPPSWWTRLTTWIMRLIRPTRI